IGISTGSAVVIASSCLGRKLSDRRVGIGHSRSYPLVRTAPAPVSAPVLDAAQRRVVEHAGGPLLVLAGPGTGKTTTLVEAAVARVEAGVPVAGILMGTFRR